MGYTIETLIALCKVMCLFGFACALLELCWWLLTDNDETCLARGDDDDDDNDE